MLGSKKHPYLKRVQRWRRKVAAEKSRGILKLDPERQLQNRLAKHGAAEATLAKVLWKRDRFGIQPNQHKEQHAPKKLADGEKQRASVLMIDNKMKAFPAFIRRGRSAKKQLAQSDARAMLADWPRSKEGVPCSESVRVQNQSTGLGPCASLANGLTRRQKLATKPCAASSTPQVVCPKKQERHAMLLQRSSCTPYSRHSKPSV